MSIINKMLQDLDRRHARSAPPGQTLHPEVHAVRAARGSSEWFWRIVAGLMLAAAVWTLWVVYQLQPRSIATELAERAAETSRRRATMAPVPAVGTGLGWSGWRQVRAMSVISIWGRLDSRAEAAALDPGSYRIQVLVANSFRRRGRCKDAVPFARQAAHLFPDAAEPRSILRACGQR